MWQLNDIGKSGSTTTDISVKTAEINLGPQQNEKTEQLSEKLSQPWIHHYQLHSKNFHPMLHQKEALICWL